VLQLSGHGISEIPVPDPCPDGDGFGDVSRVLSGRTSVPTGASCAPRSRKPGAPLAATSTSDDRRPAASGPVGCSRAVLPETENLPRLGDDRRLDGRRLGLARSRSIAAS
jgi:hypothetical protein